jgi:hypothetical protein
MKNRVAIIRLRMLSIAAIVAMAVWVAGAHSALAICCPAYSTHAKATVPAGCFPLTITTVWSNGISGTTNHLAPGALSVFAPAPPGCWLYPIMGLNINGVNVPPPPLGACVPVGIPCGVITVCVQLSPGGCPIIVVM